MVQKNGSASFAINNRKCKQMISATANWMEKNPLPAARKRFPQPTYDQAYAEIMACAKEPSFGLSMERCVLCTVFQALMYEGLYDGEAYEVWGPRAQGWVEEGSTPVRVIEPRQCLDYLLCRGRKPQLWLREGAEILQVVGPGDTDFHKRGTFRPGAEEGETADKERAAQEPKVTPAVSAAVEVEEFGEMEEKMEDMEEEEEEEMEEEEIEEREREARHDRPIYP